MRFVKLFLCVSRSVVILNKNHKINPMKKILLIIVIAFSYTIGYSQNLKPDVISSAGGFYANNNNSLSWTIGECIPETFFNSGNKLTQGFQQGIFDIKTKIDNTENRIKINLFPNPATDFVNLEMLYRPYHHYQIKRLVFVVGV